MSEPLDLSRDPEALWRAYSALCGLVAYSDIEPGQARAHLVPALNVLLHCLRAAGQPCGNDYPDPRP